MTPQIAIPRKEIAKFCRKHNIRKLSLFGSVLRDDFGPDSDIDVLVEFEPAARLSLFDFVRIQEELEALFEHKVDLVEASALRNPFRRHEIMRTQQIVYAA